MRTFFLAIVILFCIQIGSAPSLAAPALHATTDWQVQPSFAFDALCFLNTLTADSFYLTYYQAEYNKFAPKITPAAREALARIKGAIKDRHHGIISANLCLYYSAVNDTSLDQLIATTVQPSAMQTALKKTTYYDDHDWAVFDSVRPDLHTVFAWMKDIRFADYWQAEIRPKIEKRIRETEKTLSRYNVINEDEHALGQPLPSNRITVYMLFYSMPHGIRVTGTRFLTDAHYPFEIVVRNAAHELMHPPFDLAADSELFATVSELKADSFYMDKVLHHNPDFGYNSFEGALEEDCVQALEQVVSDNLKIAEDPRTRWKESDDGMHVFAVALYSVMTQENYNQRSERFRDFLIRMIRSGRLAPGSIKPVYDQFNSQK